MSELPRRGFIAAILAAPTLTEPQALAKAAVLRPGNIWVQVNAEHWKEFVRCAHELNKHSPR